MSTPLFLMKYRRALVLPACLSIVPALIAQPVPPVGSGDRGTLQVGFARVEITPETSIRLSGYGSRREETQEVAFPLWAKAVAFSGNSDSAHSSLAVLVTLDSTGVSQAFTDAVWETVTQQHPLDRDQFALTCTHTHTAPMITGVLPNLFSADIPADQQSRIDAYTDRLREQVAQGILAAIEDREQCRVVWGVGQAGFAANRRTPGGPVDHSLPVLAVHTTEGNLKGVLTTYACHCTTLGGDQNLVCGDWAGFAQSFLEARLPGATAMVSIGCGADANPQPRGSMAHAVQHGRELAHRVEAVLGSEDLKPINDPPKGQRETVALLFEPLPSRTTWEERSGIDGITGYHARKNLERLGRGEPLPNRIDYTVQSWAFGNDLAMVFLPGEVVVDYALRLRLEFDASHLWIHAYANEVRGYIPSERILKEGGYEGGGALPYYDLPAPFASGVEQRIVDAVHRILPASFHAPPNTSKDRDEARARSPQDALQTFQTHADLQVELMAAEPLVVDPVALDFGPDGRLWVLEMRDYPNGMDGNWKPGGRVRVLSDTTGDGVPDQSRVFLDNLPFPTGLMVWGNGVLVCAAPDILHAVDTNGDGRADRIETWLTGFATDNYQARVNGLSLGLDNWIHGANGLLGGNITGRFSGPPVDIRGRDFRFHPVRGRFEPASGISQQGRVRSEWGDWFGSDNSTPGWHYPIDDTYLRRNPALSAPSQRAYLSVSPNPVQVHPISVLLERFNDPDHANRVTSGCGQDIYRDTHLGSRFTGDFFLCEPVHNLVLRRKLTREGGRITGRHPEDETGRDFLTSTDPWFRPVQVRTGPDGGLWIVDMSRYVVEHPRWISPERLAELDVRAGADQGRIYRVIARGANLPGLPRDLTQMDTAALVAAMDVSNGAERDRIRQSLYHQAPDPGAIRVASSLLRQARYPEARAQVLSVLAHWDELSSDHLRIALADGHAGVRRQALVWAEQIGDPDPDWIPLLVEAARDTAEEVRFQAALTLGSFEDPRASDALADLIDAHGEDPWFRTALQSADPYHAAPLLRNWFQRDTPIPLPDSIQAEFLETWIRTLAKVNDAEGLLTAARGLSQSLAAKEASGTPGQNIRLARPLAALLAATASNGHARSLEGYRELAEWQSNALNNALTEPIDPDLASVLLESMALSRDVPEETVDRVHRWLIQRDPSEDLNMEEAVLKFLSAQGHAETGRRLLDAWRELGPGQRTRWLSILLQRENWALAVLEALESGEVVRTEITGWQQDSFYELARSAGWLERLDRVLKRSASDANSQRTEVVARYRSVSERTGRPETGKQLFQEHCAPCHRFAGEGTELGPDIALFRNKSIPDFLEAILNPSAVIEPRYVGYSVETTDDRVLTGVLEGETGTAFTLVQAGGIRQFLRRDEVRKVAALPASLMPEGFENVLDPQGMADLITYLKEGYRE